MSLAPSPIAGTTTQPLRRSSVGGRFTAPDGRVLVVGAQPLTIGRAPGADLVLAEAAVSALHCEIRAGRSGALVRDLESTNGTFVRGLRIHEAELCEAVTLEVGGVALRFEPGVDVATAAPGPRRDHFGPLVGASDAMQELYTALVAVAPTELSVLVSGETGTGKELVARALHENSQRARGPFVVVDCAALPATLAESILFGHEKGAFTGATHRTDGAFVEAHGGTLFLDELGELPEDLQPKLLRAIAERTVKRVGGKAYEGVDVRFVAATRRDLRRDMNARRFREDLFFRLAQVRLEMPALRERLEDVPEISRAICRRLGRSEASEHVVTYLTERFRGYDWPGNVRELVNATSVLAVLGAGAPDDLLSGLLQRESKGSSEEFTSAEEFVVAKRNFEERYFRALLERSDGNISEVARQCGLARHQVRSHLRKLGLS